MGYQVVFSLIAEADLHEITAYIADDNPEAATKLGAELIRLAFTLAEMPRRGGKFRRRSQLRRLVHGVYLIIYQIKESEQTIEVLRFWHGARRPPKL